MMNAINCFEMRWNYPRAVRVKGTAWLALGADTNKQVFMVSEALKKAQIIVTELGALPVERILLVGGNWNIDIEAALKQNELVSMFSISMGDRFSAAHGALTFMNSIFGGNNLVCDWGLTGLKIVTDERSLYFARFYDLKEVSKKSLKRKLLVEFLSEKLSYMMRYKGGLQLDTLLIGLPAELEESVVPRASAYDGMEGFRGLVSAAIKKSKINCTRIYIAEAIELAALGSERDACQSTLILSLGVQFHSILNLKFIDS